MIIFDDLKYTNFFPLTYTRSTGDLRCGILKLRQRIFSYMDQEQVKVILPSFLENTYKERHSDWQINSLENSREEIFINSRLKINSDIADIINALENNTCLLAKDNFLIAAKISTEKQKICSEDIDTLFSKVKKIILEEDLFWNYPWELIKENSEYIKKDFFDYFYEKENHFLPSPGVSIINSYDVWLGENSVLDLNVILDARKGPVIIDENAKVMANSVIEGPAYIGKNSLVKIGSKIYEGTSVGKYCKVGGEIEETIFQAYSNKQHDGFLGHSYVGEWVNIGAASNNSNLKNDYSNISMYCYPEKKKINTNLQFLGSIIADHSKFAINCIINTATNIGVACNLISGILIKNYVPSFSFGQYGRLRKSALSSILETAEIVKKRRKLILSSTDKQLLETIYNMEK